MERNDDINPFWIEDKSLRKGPVAFLSTAEQQFWRDLIDKYLYPIDEDKDEKARIASDLIELILEKRIYFTNSQIRDLKMRSLERNKIYFEDWRFNHAITLLAEKPNSVDRWDAILRKITMVWDRIALLKEVNMLEDIERLEAHLEQLKRALVA